MARAISMWPTRSTTRFVRSPLLALSLLFFQAEDGIRDLTVTGVRTCALPICVVDGVARDPGCEHCMVHCGYDPSAAIGRNYQRGDNWKNIKYNFGAKPKPYYAGRNVNAFNGFSIGKGHLAEAKAAINSPRAVANGLVPEATGSSCATASNPERDDLLA